MRFEPRTSACVPRHRPDALGSPRQSRVRRSIKIRPIGQDRRVLRRRLRSPSSTCRERHVRGQGRAVDSCTIRASRRPRASHARGGGRGGEGGKKADGGTASRIGRSLRTDRGRRSQPFSSPHRAPLGRCPGPIYHLSRTTTTTPRPL
jgi:hypothetical protein